MDSFKQAKFIYKSNPIISFNNVIEHKQFNKLLKKIQHKYETWNKEKGIEMLKSL